MNSETVVFGGGGSRFPAILMWGNPAEEKPPVIVSRFAAGYSVYALAVSPSGNRVAAGTKAGLLRIHGLGGYRANKDAPVQFEVFHRSAALALTFCTDDLLASGGLDGKINVWSVSERKLVAEFEAHAGGVFALCSLGSLVLASIGADGILRVWDMDSLKSKFESENFPLPKIHALTSLAYSPKPGLLMHPSRTGELHVYDARNDFAKRIVQAHHGDFCALACGSENVLTAGLEDMTLKAWPLSLDSAATEAATGSGIVAVSWSGTGQVMTASTDGCGQVWTMGGSLSPGPRFADFDLRSCVGLPAEIITQEQLTEDKKWRDEKLSEARDLMANMGPGQLRELTEIVETLRNRGFDAEAVLVLADAARAQERLLWELETCMALVEGLGDKKPAIPSLYALGDLLERIREPELAKEHFGRILSIEEDYRDVKERISRLESHPLLNLSFESSVRGDFAGRDQVIQELEKCTILGKKFQWRVLLDVMQVVRLQTHIVPDEFSDAALAATGDRGVDKTRTGLERAMLFLGTEVCDAQWVYLPSATACAGLVFTLEIRPTAFGTELVPYSLFDAGRLGIPEAASPEEHNEQFKDAWTRLVNSSGAKQWLADINALVGNAARELEGEVIARTEDEF